MTTDAFTIRPEVANFAMAMELILRKNDHKDGWKSCSPGWLLDQITKELKEAKEAYREKYLRIMVQPAIQDAIKDLQDEAVDTANFCMMLWDVLDEERRRLAVDYEQRRTQEKKETV